VLLSSLLLLLSLSLMSLRSRRRLYRYVSFVVVTVLVGTVIRLTVCGTTTTAVIDGIRINLTTTALPDDVVIASNRLFRTRR